MRQYILIEQFLLFLMNILLEKPSGQMYTYAIRLEVYKTQLQNHR